MSANALGSYLRERRTRLDPTALGYTGRRRTPGLRREEVAQRAEISATWYSFLEQGRGGAPSAQVLDRIAVALVLTEVEREHIYVLGLGRPPEVNYSPLNGVSKRLQSVLDALETCPALIRTAIWDIIAWNRAANVVFTNYDVLQGADRNILRLMFLDPDTRLKDPDWESNARLILGVFRRDVARASATATAKPLIDELCAKSADFANMWRNNTVNSVCEGIRRQSHPSLGSLDFRFSSFSVDSRPDLVMLVYTPVSENDGTNRLLKKASRRR